jgi:hypothetical protein
MNDLQTLHDAWETPEAPTPTAYTDARAALLERAAPRPRRRRRRAPFALRFAAFATVGALVATFVFVVQNLGDSPSRVSVASADQVFERAAAAAEDKPFSEPAADQWIYTKDRFTSSDGRPQTGETWHSVGGFGIARMIDGKLKRIEGPPERGGRKLPSGPLESYAAAAKLPRDPDALVRWAYREAENIEGAGLTEDGDVYAIFSGHTATSVRVATAVVDKPGER